MTEPIAAARAALEEAQTTLDKLHAGCCDPGRSPRMLEIGEILSGLRSDLAATLTSPDPLLERLEDAGSRIGRLQVVCCTPVRMPLYARILERLTEIQLQVSRATGTGH